MDEPATGREPKRARLGDRFQITCPDEKYQFVNTWFPLTVYVVNEAGQLKSGGGDKHLDLRLAVECEGEENVQYLPKLLEIDPKTPLLIPAGNGRANIRVKILECSMNDVSRNFFLEVCSAKSVKNDTDISQTRTANIVVINHQLKLSKNLTWEDEWYKDEGGREKCISFSVELCNSKNERVLDRKIPLKITLVYANGQEVGRQDILKLMECDNSLTGGCAEIKARIDEVSSHAISVFSLSLSISLSIPFLLSPFFSFSLWSKYGSCIGESKSSKPTFSNSCSSGCGGKPSRQRHQSDIESACCREVETQ